MMEINKVEWRSVGASQAEVRKERSVECRMGTLTDGSDLCENSEATNASCFN